MDRGITGRQRIDGVLLLDKPPGITSNLALQKVKRLLKAQKAGHTGTLDPFATGLLPICLGEATKFSQFLLDADKVYRAQLRLGVSTTTGDPEGEVVETRPVGVAEADIRGVLSRFDGEFLQTPPMHSAVKYAGRPLYEYARKGVEIERPPRLVTVHRLEVAKFEGTLLTLRVHSGKGLYVRTLAQDIGQALGCGAHLETLCREAVGPLRLTDAVGWPALEGMSPEDRKGRFLLVDCLVVTLPRLDLDVESAWQLSHGQAVWRTGLRVGELMRVYGPDQGFLGIAVVDDDGKAAPRRLVTA
jgi:tRNA pseudouridine55 synthase